MTAYPGASSPSALNPVRFNFYSPLPALKHTMKIPDIHSISHGKPRGSRRRAGKGLTAEAEGEPHYPRPRNPLISTLCSAIECRGTGFGSRLKFYHRASRRTSGRFEIAWYLARDSRPTSGHRRIRRCYKVLQSEIPLQPRLTPTAEVFYKRGRPDRFGHSRRFSIVASPSRLTFGFLVIVGEIWVTGVKSERSFFYSGTLAALAC